MRKHYAIFACSFILTGCDTLQDLKAIHPPVQPLPSDIQDSYCAVKDGFLVSPSSACSKTTATIPLTDYVRAGYRFVDLKCDEFFDSLADADRGFTFTRKETLAGLTAISTSLALLHNTAETLALVAAGGTFASSSIDNAEDYFLLTKYQAELKTYVDKDRRNYKAANSPEGAQTDFQADDFVRGYANRCTVATMEEEISQAINNTTSEVPDKTASALGAIAQIVQTALALPVTPTDAQIQQLDTILKSSASSDRINLASDNVFFSARSKLWGVADGILTPNGQKLLNAIDIASALDTAGASGSQKTADLASLKTNLTGISGVESAQVSQATAAIGVVQPQQNQGSATVITNVAKATAGVH